MQTNLVVVTGTIRGQPKHCGDRQRAAFTLQCEGHRFYVDAPAVASLFADASVLVVGKLVSRRGRTGDQMGIQASIVTPDNQQIVDSLTLALTGPATS